VGLVLIGFQRGLSLVALELTSPEALEAGAKVLAARLGHYALPVLGVVFGQSRRRGGFLGARIGLGKIGRFELSGVARLREDLAGHGETASYPGWLRLIG